MTSTMCYLCMLFLLAGCAGDLTTTTNKLSHVGTLNVGPRTEIRLNLDDPHAAKDDPPEENKRIYDRHSDGDAFFDQTVCVTCKWAF